MKVGYYRDSLGHALCLQLKVYMESGWLIFKPYPEKI